MEERKREGCSSKWYSYTEEERYVAHLLIELHDSEPPLFNWGRKRKRSLPIVFPSHHGGAAPSPHTITPKLLKTDKPLSPTTPLSFPPTQSDDECKQSLNKKKEYYDIGRKEEFTKDKASPNELVNGQKSEYKDVCLELGGSMQRVGENGSEREMQMCSIPVRHRRMRKYSRSCEMSGPSNGLGPVGIPHINTMGCSSQPLDANRDLIRALAAEARQRRILIVRLKYPRTKTHLSSHR